MSGIIGLSPDDDSAGPLLVSELFRQGQIGRNQFSLIMSFLTDQDSYLTFGGVPSFISNLDNFVCHRVAGSFHWQLKLLGIRVGNRLIEPIHVSLMLTDSGTTLT